MTTLTVNSIRLEKESAGHYQVTVDCSKGNFLKTITDMTIIDEMKSEDREISDAADKSCVEMILGERFDEINFNY